MEDFRIVNQKRKEMQRRSPASELSGLEGGPYAPDHRAQWLPAKVRATAHWLDDGTDCVRRWSSTARVQSDIVRRISFSNVPFRFCS